MYTDKTLQPDNQKAKGSSVKKQPAETPVSSFTDSRPEAVSQRKLQRKISENSRVKQLRAIQELSETGPKARQAAQLQAMVTQYAQQKTAQRTEAPSETVQKQSETPAKNTTGLPDTLKSGIEHLSGMDVSDIKVHYNSQKPAQLNAHAYAQGTDIHLGSGQEKHLPHEAWHVVQQKQGRVQPTKQLKGKANINDDAGLEKEADVMGARAFSMGHVTQQHGEAVQRSSKSETPSQNLTSPSVLQRQEEGELIQGTLLLEKGTKVKILKDSGKRFRVEVIETKKKYWINGRLNEYFKADSSEEVVSDPVVKDSIETPVKESKYEESESTVEVGILEKEPPLKDVIPDKRSKSDLPKKSKKRKKKKSKTKGIESGKSGMLQPPKPGEKVTMKVNPKPTLAEPMAGGKVFASGGGTTLNVEVTSKSEKEKIELKAGQNYLNDELSTKYYADEKAIKSGKVTYGKLFDGSAVLGDGHHRFLWLAHYGRSIEAQVKKTAGGQAWSGMKYQPNPKKKKKPYLQDATTPKLDIESENLDTNVVAEKLRTKWEEVNWGGLKKPGLVLSVEEEKLTTTAQYNPANHTIKLNKDEKDPVKLWDNVLFEAQNALNAKVFDKLGKEKSGKSGTTFQEYGKKMATAEYDSVNRYVKALRELIKNGLDEKSLTTLAQNNLDKWKKWDEEKVGEEERVNIFNSTPHSNEESKKDTKAALSTEELYAYEAVESSSIKTINGKTQLILKDIFSVGAKNQYFTKDQFKVLKTIVQKGPQPWPKGNGPTKIVTYSNWLEKVKNEADSIKEPTTMSGGVRGGVLKKFKKDFKTKIEGAKLTPKSVSIAKKLL